MMRPEVVQKRDGLRLSYNLPHQIYDICVYPRRSPNGSTVIIYAHDEGLRILWYGGRRFRETRQNPDAVNGESVDLTKPDHNAVQEFEDRDPEAESPQPLRDVLTHVDVSFGIACTRITTLPSLPTNTQYEYPAIFNTHIVIGVACADQSIKLVDLPLQPTQGLETDIQTTNIASPYTHHDLISSIAMTVTAEPTDHDGIQHGSRSRSQGRSMDEFPNAYQDSRNWSLLLATASQTGNGLLLVHQIPIEQSGRISTDPEDQVPIQRQYLRSPLTTCHLSFNPSIYPAERHSNLLVSASDMSAVKIYQTLPQHARSRRRRGSTATTDSAMSSNKSVRQTSVATTRPLIALLPPYAQQQDFQSLSSKRKRILDATWVAYGKAVIVLMDDGEFGIWDLEAAGPTSSATTNNLVKGQDSVSGIQGGSLAKFAVRGNIGLGLQNSKKPNHKSTSIANPSLAPMTPHTRKVRSDGLFKGAESSKNQMQQNSEHMKGTISIVPQSWIMENHLRSSEEAVLLSYDNTSVLIPSVQAYWRSGTSSRAPFDSLGSSRPIVLPVFPSADDESIMSRLLPFDKINRPAVTSLPSFVVASSSRLTIFVPPDSDGTSRDSFVSSLPMRLSDKPQNSEQTLLESGELDIDGMDRILSTMADSPTIQQQPANGFGRNRVEFHFNDEGDEDVEISTPTMPKSAMLKLNVAKNGTGGRRLFT